jgi:stage V sporulation protein S
MTMLFKSFYLVFNASQFCEMPSGSEGNKLMTDLHEAPFEDYVIDSSNPEVIKVSAKSRSTAVAGAIAGVIRQHERAEVQAIGAGAVNQAVKALAIARGYLERDDIDIACTPYFTEVDIDGAERTAVRFKVYPK